MGIEMTNAEVCNARAKPIERMFNTFKNHFSRVIDTFCGGTIIERPESLKWKLKNGIIPEDKQMRDILSTLIDGYNCDDYGGKERRYKGMTRLDVWNKSIQTTDFVQAAADDLSLLLARTTRYQKIGRNGVYITFSGEKLYYYDKETILHIGQEVYVRYDPENLNSVRIYDKDTDRYLWTWKSALEMAIPYINASKDDIATAQANIHRAEKYVHEYAKGMTADMDPDTKIDFLTTAIEAAERKKQEKYEIVYPSRIVPLLSDKIREENPNLNDIVEITIDYDKMNRNAEKRKGKV
jgi:hypothetical protein